MHMPDFFSQTCYFIQHSSSLQAYNHHIFHYTRAFSKVSPNSLIRSSRLVRDTSSMSEKFPIPKEGSAGGASSLGSV
jgi:hypothetical protein